MILITRKFSFTFLFRVSNSEILFCLLFRVSNSEILVFLFFRVSNSSNLFSLKIILEFFRIELLTRKIKKKII